jgi:hypothetical protein
MTTVLKTNDDHLKKLTSIEDTASDSNTGSEDHSNTTSKNIRSNMIGYSLSLLYFALFGF